MVEIDDTIISLDVLEKKFCCNISACKGACCVEGDSGAPLEPEEIESIESSLQSILSFLPAHSVKVIEEGGVAITDSDGDIVTPLIKNKECAFAFFTGDTAQCAIEKSWLAGNCKLQKPVSCHLYPVRLKKYNNFTAINLHVWDICRSAYRKGEEKNMPLVSFLEKPLIRKFGAEWYKRLLEAHCYINE